LLALVALSRGHFPVLTTFEQSLLVLGWALRASLLGALAGLLVVFTQLPQGSSPRFENVRKLMVWLLPVGLLATSVIVGGQEPDSRWWRLGAPTALPPLEQEGQQKGQQEGQREDAPNIVLISVETTRRDSLSLYGYSRETSPRLERYARGGAVFEMAIAQAPETSHSMASLMTGHLPYVIAVERRARGRQGALVAEGFSTLAERLAAVGYETHAVVSNSYLKKENGFGQGFSTYDDRHTLDLEEAELQTAKGDVVELSMARLESVNPPFFLWLHVPDPHHPYTPVSTGPWEQEEGDAQRTHRAKYEAAPFEEITSQIRALPDLAEPERSAALAYLKARYDSEILEVDKKVDGLLRSLTAHGYDDTNTLVVFLADHGEEFLDHEGMLHSHSLRDELLRVPLFFRGAGIPGGVRIEGPVSLVDVGKTLLERAGVETSQLPGQSLVDFFDTETQTEEAPRVAVSVKGTSYISLRSKTEKLIVAFEPYDLNPIAWWPWKSLGEMTRIAIHRKSRPEVGYWNLEDDPQEKVNRLGQSKQRVRALYDDLMEQRRRDPVRAVESIGADENESGLSPDERERLRRLGYVE
jgi:arylsulfatase A-like enzyme